MAGLLVSCLIAGHLADSIGRKPTFYLSLLILTISNLGAAFSVSWEMFAVLRFIIGIGCGINLTVCVFVIEFIPTKFRAYILAIPKWPVCAAFYALVSWWLRDWAYLHFATAIATAPMLLGFFVVPESFRWLASHNKIEEVENIVNSIASVNGKAAPELNELKTYAKKDFTDAKHYTLMDILRSGNLARYTCMLCFSWCSCGYTYYSISFGVQQLSGSLYLNMFLLSFVEIPSTLMAAYLNNRIGRRWTCFLLFMLGAVGGAAVGIVQVLDPPGKGAVINGCALTAKLGVSASWSALITFTSETFPTVVSDISHYEEVNGQSEYWIWFYKYDGENWCNDSSTTSSDKFTGNFKSNMEKDAINELLEDVIEKCGGLGKFQFLIIVITYLSKISVTWSMLMMTFGGATPDWWCVWHDQNPTTHEYSHILSNVEQNHSVIQNPNETLKACQPSGNESYGSCSAIFFASDMNTIVSEYQLICDRGWITSTITTIQMAGLLISGFLAGHLADTIGRKPTFFSSILILTITNLASVFSISWEMFAVFRFIIGVGCGMYLTTIYIFIIEFVPIKYRSMITAIPAWPVFAAFYALVAWWLHDWKNLHYATAIGSAPLLLGIFIIPESFRWLVSRYKAESAKNVIRRIASINGKPTPSLKKIEEFVQKQGESDNEKKYSLIDIFRDGKLTKNSLLIWFSWFACGYSYYAISFGVEQLSGSLYLNMFLLSAVEIPSLLLTWFLNNRIGRRWTCFLFFMISAIGGAAVGTVQVINPPQKSSIVNYCALAAKLGVSAGWAALMVFTTETYPTVIRNIGYGFANSITRVGGMIAPQIVHVSTSTPGLMYYLCGGAMFLSAFCCILLPETNGKTLEDELQNNTIPYPSILKNENIITKSFTKNKNNI